MVAFASNTNRGNWLDICRVRFAKMLPQIRQEANAAFHSVPAPRREQLINEVVERAFDTLLRLAERGKLQIAYAKPLTMVAIKQMQPQQTKLRFG